MADRSPVVIRHFRSGDENQVNDLFNDVFGTNRPLEQWRWKFQVNPASRVHPTNIVLGESEGRIVSQLASMARDLLLRGAPCTAVQIVDNLVHPDFRGGRHLLRDMLAHFGELMTARGNDFTFGCPNDIHYRVGKRLLAYDDFFAAKRLVRRLRLRLSLRRWLPSWLGSAADAMGDLSAAAIRLFLRAGGAQRYRVETAADERFDRLWELAKGRFMVLGVRDRQYVQWRYFQRPDARFRFLSAGNGDGMSAWIALNVTRQPDGSRVGYVIDFLYRERPVMQQLLRRGLKELSRMGADYALAVAAPGSDGEALLRAAGFDQNRGFEPVRMSIRWYAMRDEQLQREVLDPVNWHLCHGDLDLQL